MKLKIKEDIAIYAALEILEGRLRKNPFELKNADETKEFLTLKLTENPHEMFSVLFLGSYYRWQYFNRFVCNKRTFVT